MAALDTNVLVRFLVRDDEHQLASANRLIAAAVRRGETLFVPVTVMLELEWVLRSRFGFTKETVSSVLAAMLGSRDLTFESEGAIEVALATYQAYATDFSDCMHAALAHAAGQTPLWTFDRAAAKLDGAKLVPA